MTERLDLLARCALGIGAVIVAASVARARAPRDAAVTPVPPVASASALATTSSPNEVDEVFVRLTEKVGDAQLEMPNRERGLAELPVHWRRMQAPWKDTSKQAHARLVQLVALRTSQTEVAHVVTTKTGGTATFDAKKWNMSEGSFAQREAIVAPTPSTLRFRVRVPPHAALELAPAVLAIGEAAATGPAGEVTFVARAVPVTGGAAVEIGRLVVDVGERDRWHEHRFDLSALAGKEIDLELVADAAVRPDFPNGAGLPSPLVLALWGTPRIVRKAPARVPYNVLWIVVDSLRPDVLASFHDPAADEKKRAAKIPPRDTLLPAIPGLTPNLDALARRGTIFRQAISAAPWTRPGTIAMLSGVHSRQLGVSPLPWIVPSDQLDAYYASDAPLVPLAFRRAGVATRAFVNNNFMLGYAAVAVDMGFEHVEDYRYRTRDTAEVTRTAIEALRAHAGERFFQFVNYNSPHEPFDPPVECLARVPGAIGPKKKPANGDEAEEKKPAPLDPVKAYMAEACKDDAAIGELLETLDDLHLREKTIVVVTADHGETLSDRHDGIADDLDEVNTRFHHAFGMWEETTRIPILLSLPGVIPEGLAVDGRVTNLDIAPTLLHLEGLDVDPRQKGIDLLAAAKAGVPERPIVTLGRASSAVFWKNWRFVLRDREAQKWTVGRGDDRETLVIHHELYDLDTDPGETKNLGGLPAHAALVEEMRARLTAALAGAATADAAPELAVGQPARIELRLVGGGGAHRVHATIRAPGATSITATPVGLAHEALRTTPGVVELAATTAKDGVVGLDLVVVPANTPISWSFSWNDKPLGDDRFFGGVLGVTSAGLSSGLPDALLRSAVAAKAMPWIDPELDRGVFVVRIGGSEAPERAPAGAAAEEVKSALRQWGYAK